MKLHPLTHIIISVEFTLLTLILPVYQGLGVLTLWLLFTLVIPQRTETKLTGTFIKILVAAAVFLFLIHGLNWRTLDISTEGIVSGLNSLIHTEGIVSGLNSLIHIAAPVTFIIYLSRMVQSEEIFALLVDLRIPSAVILILFRTIWLVPRFVERIDEVITAQKLRGMRIETTSQRIRALIPTLSPIFSSMLEEISENSLTIAARGFLQPGKKSHLKVIEYRIDDAIVIIFMTFIMLMLWF